MTQNLRFFFFAVFLAFLVMLPVKGSADSLSINIGLNPSPPPPPVYVAPAPPPAYRAPAPPAVAIIPGTYVYYAPDVSIDILFFQGSWYRPHHGHWYASRSYNGPWAYVPPPRVPRAVIAVPRDYRGTPPGHARIHHKELQKNWKKWERQKHWDKKDNWKDNDRGRQEERGRDHRGR